MSAKYSGLPDIDSAPDVFETPDEPEVTHRRDDDNGEDTRKAALPAPSKEIDTGHLPPRRRAGNKFAAAGDAAIPAALPKETPLARLRRLQAEVAQLEAEVTAAPAAGAGASGGDSMARDPRLPSVRRSVVPSRQKVDLVTELAVLRERLGGIACDGDGAGQVPSTSADWQARLKRLEISETASTPAATDGDAPPQTTVTPVHAENIDRRLAALEAQVGVAHEGDASSSLVDTLNRMDHVLSVLTQPRHLDSIARRIKLLLVDLDRATAASRRATTSAPGERAGSGSSTMAATTTAAGPNTGAISTIDAEALQSLFALLPRLDPLIPVIPALLARLRSLATLHAEALGVAADLRELQASDRGVADEERELHAIVAGVQTGVSEAVAAIGNNWEAVQARVQALEERMAALSG